MSSPEHKQLIWNLIEDVGVGMLTTQDGDDLRARPMKLVQNDYDGTLWFFTKRSTEKVMEAAGEQAVCVTFESPEAQTYVSLSGRARLSSDPNLIEKFWNPWAAAWFPRGKNDPDVVLLEVKVHKGEHWKNDENLVLKLVEYAKANVTAERPNLGENQKFG
jgi:general stress protein 26